MRTSSNGRQLIESFEGLFLEAYDDYNDHILRSGDTCRGTLTIGYGHTTAAGGVKVFIGQKITKEEADSLLLSDLGSVEKEVTSLVTFPINQNEFDALVSFHYNTGALGRSSLLKYLNAGKLADAGNAFLLYNKGNGQVLPGLVRRRQAEKALFLKPYVGNTTSHTTAGAVIASGSVILATQPNYWPEIIVGTLLLSVLAWLTIHYFTKGKNV